MFLITATQQEASASDTVLGDLTIVGSAERFIHTGPESQFSKTQTKIYPRLGMRLCCLMLSVVIYKQR